MILKVAVRQDLIFINLSRNSSVLLKRIREVAPNK